MGHEDSSTPYRGMHQFFQQQEDLQQKKLIQEAHQHRKAVWMLADHLLPPDTREMARRWGMEEVMCEMWRNAFIAGWRAAHKETK